MADYITKIRTIDGDKQIDYNALANLPDLAAIEEDISQLSTNKADTGHKHSASDITSGTLSADRGGTGVTSQKAISLLAYPVNSIYISVNSTSPASLFGGTWEQLKDRFLIGAGSTYSNGATGGAANVTLTEETIPDHRHAETMFVDGLGTLVFDASGDTTDWKIGYTYGTNLKMRALQSAVSGVTSGIALTTVGAGGGQAHNNMPPYLVVYMWKRTA